MQHGGDSACALQPNRTLSTAERTTKRAIDIVGALVFFAVFGPLYLLVAMSVLVSMGRPVHYWQNRLGRGGRRFRFHKFRSMVRNSHAALDEFLSVNDMARTEWDTFQKLENHYCAMRPGITGLWQVSGRNRLSYAKRVEFDALYVDNWSLMLDFKILFKTVRTVITGEGSR